GSGRPEATNLDWDGDLLTGLLTLASPNRCTVRCRAPGRKRRAAAVAAVVAPARVPWLGLRERQPKAAGAARGLLGLVAVALAAAEVVAVVIVVVAQAEEPHQPHDEGSDVEDSKANHEDPPLQAHAFARLSQPS